MLKFAAVFGLIKCIKSLIPGIFVLLLIASFHFFNRKKSIGWNLYSFLFLFPLCLMGYSKLYFTRHWIHLNNWLYQTIRPFHGYLYFSVAGILFLISLIRSRRFHRRIRNLLVWDNEFQKNLQEDIIKTLSGENKLIYHYLSKIKIYQTKEDVSPFSGGIFHPYVVLPSKIIDEWNRMEIQTILCHEMVHIRYGHILFLFFFSLLKIYWWINPFSYLAEKKLREDMELFCDEKCLYHTDMTKNTYGTLLLRMLYFLQDIPRENVTAFSYKKNFQLIKHRMEHLNFVGKETIHRSKRMAIVVITLLLFVTVFISATSFPRYVIDHSVSLHDEYGRLLIYDTPKLREAVQVSDKKIHLNPTVLRELLQEKEIASEFIYINFGNIQKTPGVGGHGMIAMIDLKADYHIEYFGVENWRSKIEEFFLKYMI
ncbi:MAG: M56 family metallopeptidase [Lachnospiraceae bacterium]|nr:M56 family metallopeptidase [Lachnospiraceae bacterium]